ncbi:MAG TPA: hypothetical protein VF121_07810 [Thermoanaerobaculia bacterium]|nr:hypothetical protein [Thermoanaerobaculia bacterium]
MTERWILVVVGLFLAAAPAAAGGFACGQDCTVGECSQTACAIEEAGVGSCRCAERAIAWADGTYASWCRSWSHPAANQGCAPSPSAEESAALSQAPGFGRPDLRLDDPEAVLAVLGSRNLYLSTLVGALIEDGSWVEGPVQGLIHDSRFDEATASLAHAPALRFTGLVVTGGLGAAQIQLTVHGDLGGFAHLRERALAVAPASLVPVSLSGTVTEQGRHGSLVIAAGDGKSETIQW